VKTEGISVSFDGVFFEEWTEAEVTRDIKDLSGAFTFTLRDDTRSIASLPFGTMAAAYRLRPGAAASVYVDGQLCLVGYVDKVSPEIDASKASVTVEGRDKTSDLVDSSALVDQPAEYKSVKLEDATSRIAQPFGLNVRSEIDTGEPFERYGLDLAETAHSAIEKGARSRHALVTSDGVGGVVLTRAGSNKAPGELRLPGNVISSSGSFDNSDRHSETIVRGQGEFAGKKRTADAALDRDAAPIDTGAREPGDGSATEMERKGTAATGRVKDDEITRYRPIVHLARTKAAEMSAQDEADWRMRTKRGQSEELTYTVKGHSVNGSLWRPNELVPVADAFQDVNREMLISAVRYIENEGERTTELTVTSPEAFDKGATGSKRTNAPSKSAKSSGALDGTAKAL
jgi:prophage tail gpP-like protein